MLPSFGTDSLVIDLASEPERKFQAVCLIGDTPNQRTYPCKARELFDCPLFRDVVTFADLFAKWFIVSSKHGILSPEDVVQPYGDRIEWFDAYQRHQWMLNTSVTLKEIAIPQTPFVCLAGGQYLRTFRRMGISLICPLAGMSTAQRRRWLKESVKDRRAANVALEANGGVA